MEEQRRTVLELRQETIEAFCEAARRAGRQPDEILESLIQDFLKKEGKTAFQSRIRPGMQGKPLQEIFEVRIECEDELCRTPRIRMDTRGPESGNEPAKR